MKYGEVATKLSAITTIADLPAAGTYISLSKAKMYVDGLSKAVSAAKNVASQDDATKNFGVIWSILSDALICSKEEEQARDKFFASLVPGFRLFQAYKFETGDKYVQDLKGFLKTACDGLIAWKGGSAA